mmetsp:Transcript_60544/g.190310  ORF Transcript_60544/g.190310 Transcript_60544/m.190310 type:complete len:238 (+) Transcript_60544:728-1441(+)
MTPIARRPRGVVQGGVEVRAVSQLALQLCHRRTCCSGVARTGSRPVFRGAPGEHLRPDAHRVIHLRVEEYLEQWQHDYKYDRLQGNPRGEDVGQLAGNDLGHLDPGNLLAQIAAQKVGNEAQDLQHPAQAAGARPQLRGARCTDKDEVLASRCIFINPDWLRSIVAQHVGDVEGHGERANKVHPEEEAERVRHLCQTQAEELDRKQQKDASQYDVQFRVRRHLAQDKQVSKEEREDQ